MPDSSKIETRLSQHDKEIAAIRKLIVQGMRMLVSNERQIKANAAAIQETNKTLDRFIRSLEGKPRNGNTNN
jgi:hypothetical protein